MIRVRYIIWNLPREFNSYLPVAPLLEWFLSRLHMAALGRPTSFTRERTAFLLSGSAPVDTPARRELSDIKGKRRVISVSEAHRKKLLNIANQENHPSADKAEDKDSEEPSEALDPALELTTPVRATPPPRKSRGLTARSPDPKPAAPASPATLAAIQAADAAFAAFAAKAAASPTPFSPPPNEMDHRCDLASRSSHRVMVRV